MPTAFAKSISQTSICMTKAFLDSDVVLDLLLDREPFVADAARIFALGERKEVELYTSTVSFLNIYYVAARLKGKEAARSLLRQLRRVVSLLPVNESMVDEAFDRSRKDIEDYVQLLAAGAAGMDYLVTRNGKDYPRTGVPVVVPRVLVDSVGYTE